MADTLEKLPWKPEEKDKGRKDGAIGDIMAVLEEKQDGWYHGRN